MGTGKKARGKRQEKQPLTRCLLPSASCLFPLFLPIPSTMIKTPAVSGTGYLFLFPCMSKVISETPLMLQHKAIKQKYPDAILLFRVGDFYETFGQDAVIAAQVLGITLTRRNNGSPSSSELAGFPHHSLDTYLHKLVKAGYRVAICDQLEDPKTAKGIVKRGVTELVTPGIATNDRLLEHGTNNFLAALHIDEKQTGIALLDISTGEFFVAEGNQEYIDKLLQSLKPAEVIFQRNHQRHFKEMYGSKF
jgi:DNA mismatch repair protein MutS